jgi:histidinol-phosphate aminotransferase
LWALKDEEHVKYTREINEQGKRLLYTELNTLGLNYIPTEANFIYILLGQYNPPCPPLLKGGTGGLYNELLRHGVIVRPVGPKEIRVTIGLPEENKRFIEALKTVISHQSIVKNQ